MYLQKTTELQAVGLDMIADMIADTIERVRAVRGKMILFLRQVAENARTRSIVSGIMSGIMSGEKRLCRICVTFVDSAPFCRYRQIVEVAATESRFPDDTMSASCASAG